MADENAKAWIVERLRESGETVVASLRALPAGEFERGRYENGWNARQILAHIASIEWTYPRLLEVSRESAGDGSPPGPVRRTAVGESSGIASRTAQGGIDAYNARQVEKRATAPANELIAEFEKNRAATVAAVSAADDELLRRAVRSAGGVTGSLADVLDAVAVEHVLAHARDIVADQSGGP